MRLHYIYHIPEREKIGVTYDLNKRMRQHRWTGDYAILECHTDVKVAGDREQELQREYGYPVDVTHYTHNIQNGLKGYAPNKAMTNEQADIIRDRWHEEPYLNMNDFIRMIKDETGMSYTAIRNLLLNLNYCRRYVCP